MKYRICSLDKVFFCALVTCVYLRVCGSRLSVVGDARKKEGGIGRGTGYLARKLASLFGHLTQVSTQPEMSFVFGFGFNFVPSYREREEP